MPQSENICLIKPIRNGVSEGRFLRVTTASKVVSWLGRSESGMLAGGSAAALSAFVSAESVTPASSLCGQSFHFPV